MSSRAASSQATPVPTPAPAPAPYKPDVLSLKSEGPAEAAHEPQGEHAASHDAWRELAHQMHNPHGALHLVEASEHGLGTAARVLRAGRGAAAVAEAAPAAHGAVEHVEHNGLVQKFEHALEKRAKKVGGKLSALVEKLPGGSRVLKGASVTAKAPASAAQALDKALVGTRFAKTLKFSGAGARLLKGVGGRIPVVGTLAGGVIGVADVRDMVKTLRDPKASTRDKWVAAGVGTTSGASAVLGLGALGVAGATAIGLTAPLSVPVLLTAAAVTGAASFGLSFLKHD